MSLDKLPNELIRLVAQHLGDRELYSLVLTARRFYCNGDLMNRLYAEKAIKNNQYVHPSVMHAAFLNQTSAFVGLINAWLNSRKGKPFKWENTVRFRSWYWKDTPFEKWKVELHRESGVCDCDTSALHIASHADSAEMMEFILSKGADPSTIDQAGYSPLHIAALGGKTAAIKLLIASGADVNASILRRRRFGPEINNYTLIRTSCTPFHLAAKYNRMAAAKLLVDAGADHWGTTIDGDDPLTLAVRGCVSVEFFHYLLGLGYGSTLLCRALVAASGCGDVLRGKILIDAGARVTFDCLVEALGNDDLPMARLLVGYKGDLLEIGIDGRSALYFARSEAAAQILLDKNPRITTVGSYHTGPLSHLRDPRPKLDHHWRKPKIDVVSLTTYLITHGCPVDDRTMLWATTAGTLSILEALNTQSRPFIHIPSVRDDLGNSPLHLAMFIRSGYRVKWIDFLLELGADANAVNKRGETPLLYVFGRESTEFIPAELDVIMKRLIDAGLDISIQASSDGTTACHRALRKGHTWVANFLLDAGANINSFDKEGETVIHAAARVGYLEIIEKLTRKGVDISVMTKKRGSVLHSAVHGALDSQTRSQSYLKLLACIVLGYEVVSIETQLKGEILCTTGHMELIRLLIRQWIVDPLTANRRGHTAFDIIKLDEPRIDWGFLESLNGTTAGHGEIVRWITNDLTLGMGDLDISFETFEAL